MDANVTPQVEAEPFEAMKVYYDDYEGKLILGKHINEMARHAMPGKTDILPSSFSDFTPATPEETLAYWAAVAIQVEAERLDFESRMAEMTGHHVEVRVDIYPARNGNYDFFEAAKSVDGYRLDSGDRSQWVINGPYSHGNTTIFGSQLPEQPE